MLKPSLQLAFDDVWLEPQYSEINSRADPCLVVMIGKYEDKFWLEHPVIASNMSSVVGLKMAETLDSTGGIAIHHRFQSKETLLDLAAKQILHCTKFAFSVGIKNEDYEIAQEVFDTVGKKGAILVDIAHGHTKRLGLFLEKIAKIGFPVVIAGNVATADGYKYLADFGANAVRVGVAGGRGCTTKYVTGHHVPTLQSVLECDEARKNAKFMDVAIIADGGIKTSGDALKAIAAGADCVCVGGLLASTSDSPSELVEQDGEKYKMYYGMSSQMAIDKYFHGKKNHVTPEGKSELLPYTGETLEIIEQFLGGIRAGLTYTGAINLSDFQEKAIIRYKKTV